MEQKTSINAKLLMVAVASVFLVACKSTPITPAKVEDKSPTASTGADVDAGADTGAIKEVTVDSSANSAGNSALTDPNNILSKRHIYFEFDSDAVKAEYRPIVEAHAKYMVANPNAKMVLQGNADERGTHEYNLSLGQRRAVAVKTALNLLGVKDSQIETVSYGEERATQNCSGEGCDKDRRVDIVHEGD